MINRILAVKLADLGDALLIVPALRALKKAFPSAKLDVLTTKNGEVGLQGLAYLNQILPFDETQFKQNLGFAANFIRTLRSQRYDAVIFFHHFSLKNSAIKFQALAHATGASYKVGLHNGTFFSSFLNVSIQDEGFGANGWSERDYWQHLVQAFIKQVTGTIPPDYDASPEIYISPTDELRASKLFQQCNAQSVIAFGAGSGGYSLTRRWPAVNFARLADLLTEQHNAKIILLGSKSEQELANQIIKMANCPIESLCGQTNPKEVVAFLRKCDLFVGNDGGLAHLAGVAGTKSIVIFGPTNSVAWSPFGTENGQVKIVQAQLNLPCRPCLYRGKELGSRLGCAGRPCLTTISSRQVLEASNVFLG